jgi:5,10-methylenetetrahydromethanopterin reductase
VNLPPAFTELAARKDRSLLLAAMSALPDEALERTVLVGTPALVAQQVSHVLRDEVSLVTIRPHAVPGQSVGEVIRAFAEDVMPRVWRERGRAREAERR